MSKTWLITGASRGLGRALAQAVLEAGISWSPPRDPAGLWPPARQIRRGGSHRHARRDALAAIAAADHERLAMLETWRDLSASTDYVE